MTKKYGILAYPAKHSLSPAMYNAAFKALKMDAEYGVYEISENELEDFVTNYIRQEGINGLSVSLPYKEEILKYLNVLSDDVKQIKACNTLVNEGGFFHGYNTDFIGSNKALIEAAGSLKNKKIVIMGAGGAARAIAYGLLKEGANISIYNRTKEKALTIENDFSKIFGVKIITGTLEDMLKLGKSDIFIQATSLWTLNPDITESEISALLPSEFLNYFDFVSDIAYEPLITPVLKIAQDLGKKIITGDKMLLYQAVEQFKLLTGKEAPLEVMENTLNNNL